MSAKSVDRHMGCSNITPPAYERVIRQVWEQQGADLIFIVTSTRERADLYGRAFGSLLLLSICMRLPSHSCPSGFVHSELSHVHLKG